MSFLASENDIKIPQCYNKIIQLLLATDDDDDNDFTNLLSVNFRK